MSAQHTPEKAAMQALQVYANGLDASVDGRGFGAEHEAARQLIVKMFQDRAQMLAALMAIVELKVITFNFDYELLANERHEIARVAIFKTRGGA